MAFQPGANLNTVAFANRPENVEVPHLDVRPPAISDVNYPIGKRWIYVANGEYTLLSQSSLGGVLVSNWVLMGTTGGALNTLTGDSGTATPVGNNIQIAGTAGQISTAGAGAAITLSLPAAITAPGSLTTTTTLAVGTNATVGGTLGVTGATTLAGLTAVGTVNINATGAGVTTIGTGGTGATNIGNATGNTAVTGSLTASTTLTATLGAITATNGNLVLGTAGNKIIIPTGANASVGTSGAMSGTPGAVTVATTASSATAKIFYCRNVTGGTPGQVSITAQDGTGFTLTSTGNETSTFNWWIINA